MNPEIKTDISESSNKIIELLAIPASKEIGKALGNIFGILNTATLPIKLANNYAKRNFEIYNEKIKKIPKEKIKSVEPEIGIPIFEKLTYTSNEELSNAYANLLASASNSDKNDFVHPGFINKINSMAPDEIRIIELLKNNPEIYYITFKATKDDGAYIPLSLNLTSIEDDLNLPPERIDTHINNLISLNIIKDHNGWGREKHFYEDLFKKHTNLKNEFELNLKNKVYKDCTKIRIENSYYSLTTLGKIFINSCANS